MDVNVRNLDQIQEDDPGRRSSKLGALLLASIGGAALVTVGVLTFQKSDAPPQQGADPLAALIEEQRGNEGTPPEQLAGADVTFPGLLSDVDTPTTALAAVKDSRGKLLKQDAPALNLPPGAPTLPPPAGDVLPVMPLPPAGDLLAATPVTSQPKDPLVGMAVSDGGQSGALAPMGMEGGFQLQVASFKKQEDADAFVADLRRRDHKAYRQAARVPGRGLWHRVRVGPFKTKFQAIQYKKKFEKSERVAPFIVDPHTVKHRANMRKAKLEARKRKFGRP